MIIMPEYENKESKTAVVTDLDPKKEAEIREAAVKVYETMGCSGLARVDLFPQGKRKGHIQ